MDNNWNSLLQKLGTKVPDQNPRSFEETNLSAGLLQQLAHLAQVSTDQSAVPFQPNELSLGDRDDPNVSNKSDKAASALIANFIEENSDLQINDVKNFAADQRTGRTIALNSRFVCYQDTNNTLVIKSLKNLSLNYRIDNLNARIADIAFLDDILSSYLAVVTTEGILLVISIDMSQAKDKIISKYFLKHNFEKTCERVQIQWKDQSKIGVVVDNQLIIFELPNEESSSETEDNIPKASFQEPFQTEINIRDFTFSPNYPLVYFLLENNRVQIFNIENRTLLNEFAPHNSGTVLRVLSYKSLIRHEIKSDEKSGDAALRDIFLTVTEGFEIKVWDLSEWHMNKRSYYCIETFQLPQSNDNIDPIALIKRFVFYDAGLNFIFVVFKTNDDRGICLNALHIDNFYSGYSDIYDQVKKNKRFFNSTQTVFLKQNDLTDLSVLNLADDEMDFYFKKNTYPLMADTEPASTRTQDGSYAYSTKTVLSFFTHADSAISVFKTIGEKLYPLGFIEEFEKINQVDQLESQSDSSYPPDLPGFVKKLHQETKNQARRGEEKKEETSESIISPEVTKQPTSQKKKTKEHKKDLEREDAHEHGKHNKGGPTKIVTRNEKPNQGKSAAEGDASSQTLDKILEKRFQELTDKSIQQLNHKFSKIEEIIESKVNERVSKLHAEAITSSVSREIDEKLQREFSHAFEKTVTPCFERYLGKMFEQVCASFEKGSKFYIDKLNVEQAKGAQVKETMNEVVKSFVQISNSLTESYANNQATFNKMETNIQEKQGQVSRLIDQMNEIIQRQHDIQKKLSHIESEGTYHQKEAYPKNPYMYPAGTNQFYHPSNGAKDAKVAHPLNDQLAYLQSIIGGRSLDLSGGGIMQPPRTHSVPGTSSPGANSQVFDNPYQQQQQQQHGYGGYYNPYQKGAFNPNFPGGNQSGGQSGEHPPFYNPAQGNVQPTPELLAFYKNHIDEMLKLKAKEKEEEKEKASPYLSNPMVHDNAKKFFDLAQIAQGQPAGNADLRGQRTLSQVENQGKTNLPPLALNPTSSQPHDPENVSSRSSTPLPPGIQQPANQGNQPNFVQNLLQNLPQSMQQQFAQAQLTPQKGGLPPFQPSQPQTAGQTPSNQQNQKTHQIGAGFNPELYFGNPNNFPAYYNPMNNAQINRSSGTKTTSVDINQIPLVNSMFKTPSRDANDETSSTGGTNNNLS